MMKKQKDSAEKAIRDIRRVTRRQYSIQQKKRSASCLKDCAVNRAWPNCAARKASTGICTTVGAKYFLEAGKKRLAGDTFREANSDEVVGLKKENTNFGFPRQTAPLLR
jgi:transposase